jgi:molybdopterin/thiamine biosynthesis adenylyltransferase
MKNQSLPVVLRMAAKERDILWELLFSRYPNNEWGTFIELGWRESNIGLTFTVKNLIKPDEGDINKKNWMTEISSQYIRRVLRNFGNSPYSTGFVHSHPEGYGTEPSDLDDDMEEYCSSLLRGYNDNPFLSLIFSKKGAQLSASGRVYWKGQCYQVTKFLIEGCVPTIYDFDKRTLLSDTALKRVARLASVFSFDAANSLAGSKVGIVGLSGTGSPVAELLARAGIGQMVLIDPDTFSDSNLERVHGSEANDVDSNTPKALLARRHVLSINPDCKVIAIEGRLPQTEVVDALLSCDIVIGCTDLHSSRVSLTELSIRYLVPVIDVGVSMEGKDGNITGQVMQINRLFPSEPCVYCRGMINPQIVSQELLSEDERKKRITEAERAHEENRPANAYWIDMPQLNTVGYLTTMVGSLCSGFVIGYLTNRFCMPKNRLEMTLSSKGTQLVEKNATANPECVCQTSVGCADQSILGIISSAPAHWFPPIIHFE